MRMHLVVGLEGASWQRLPEMLMAAGLDWSDPEVLQTMRRARNHTCKSPLESLHFGMTRNQLEHVATFQQLRGIGGFVKTLRRESKFSRIAQHDCKP